MLAAVINDGSNNGLSPTNKANLQVIDNDSYVVN